MSSERPLLKRTFFAKIFVARKGYFLDPRSKDLCRQERPLLKRPFLSEDPLDGRLHVLKDLLARKSASKADVLAQRSVSLGTATLICLLDLRIGVAIAAARIAAGLAHKSGSTLTAIVMAVLTSESTSPGGAASKANVIVQFVSSGTVIVELHSLAKPYSKP